MIAMPEDQGQHISPDCTPGGKSIWSCKSTESKVCCQICGHVKVHKVKSVVRYEYLTLFLFY